MPNNVLPGHHPLVRKPAIALPTHWNNQVQPALQKTPAKEAPAPLFPLLCLQFALGVHYGFTAK